MKFYQVSFIDHEDNATYRIFANKKDAKAFIKTGDEYVEIISHEPELLILPSTRKSDLLKFINSLHY